MQKLNDLSRSLTPLDPDGTLIAVIEMSQSSWLVAGIVPGVERVKFKPPMTEAKRRKATVRNCSRRPGIEGTRGPVSCKAVGARGRISSGAARGPDRRYRSPREGRGPPAMPDSYLGALPFGLLTRAPSPRGRKRLTVWA